MGFLSRLLRSLIGLGATVAPATKTWVFDDNVTISKTTANPYFIVNASAGQARGFRMHTGGAIRWIIAANNTAEAGANAGSNLDFYFHADDGTLLGTAMSISRKTGGITVFGNISLTGGVIDGAAVIDATTEYRVNTVQVLGAQAAAIADAAGGATVDTEARAALNDLLAKLRTHGIIAT